jgi:hypothetical protein
MVARLLVMIELITTCLPISPLLLASHQSPDDALQSGTVWTGQAEGDPRKPKQDRDRGAEMRITSRDGEVRGGPRRARREGDLRAAA